MKPGDLCYDGDHLCVLVKIGTTEDAPWTKLMAQAGMLQPFGWFLDLEEPNVKFETIKWLVGDNVSGCWIANLFSRNLNAVTWKETS